MQRRINNKCTQFFYCYPYKILYLLVFLYRDPNILLFTLFFVYILPCFHPVMFINQTNHIKMEF
jgi:hypothetical protein